MLVIEVGGDRLTTNDLDIDFKLDFYLKKQNLIALTIYEIPEKTKFIFEESRRKIKIYLYNNLVFDGEVINTINNETEEDLYYIVLAVDSNNDINNEVVSFNLSNTTSSRILSAAATKFGVSIGKLTLKNDVFFKNYTVLGTLKEIIEDFIEITETDIFISNNTLYATNDYIDTEDISSEIVSFKKQFGDRNKIVLGNVLANINNKTLLTTDRGEYIAINGIHRYSSSGGYNYTEIEVGNYE